MKIAIYGGSFDPLHKGHLQIIETLSKTYDKVIVVPTTIRYYKVNKNMFSFNERYEAVKSKVSHLHNVEVSNIEALVDDKWRFVDTLKAIKCGALQSEDFYVAMGADSFINFKSWDSWTSIIANANIVVFGRPGYSKDSFPTDVPFAFVEMNCDASSTSLRKKLIDFMNDEDFENYLSDIGFAVDTKGEPINFNEDDFFEDNFVDADEEF